MVVQENDKLNQIIGTHLKNNDFGTIQELERRIGNLIQEKEKYMQIAEQF